MRTVPFVLLLGLAIACTPGPETGGEDDTALRLVVVSPAAAEMLDALDAGDLVVGVGDYVHHPAELAGLPRVGSYDNPNVERVLGLRADILVTARSEAAGRSNRRLRELGVEVLEVDTSGWEGTRSGLLTLGARIGAAGRADRLLNSLDRAMDRIRRKVEAAPRPAVLFVVGRDPLYVAGPGSLIDEMIRIAGGVNVVSDAGAPYRMVSLEAMLQRSPDVIIDTSDNSPAGLRGRLPGPWGTWEFLPAVRANRVFWVDPDLLVVPGIRLPAMTERVGRMIHPEIFGDPDENDYIPEKTLEDWP